MGIYGHHLFMRDLRYFFQTSGYTPDDRDAWDRVVSYVVALEDFYAASTVMCPGCYLWAEHEKARERIGGLDGRFIAAP